MELLAEIAVRILRWAWEKAEFRSYIVNFILMMILCAVAFVYVNVRHAEAMGEIRNLRADKDFNESAIREQLGRIAEDVKETKGNVQRIYNHFLND